MKPQACDREDAHKFKVKEGHPTHNDHAMEPTSLDNLIAYQKAVLFAGKTIRLTRHSGLRDHSWFCDQIRRAALSVPSNLAEGYERRCGKDTSRFYRISLGSCAEVRAQLNVAIVSELVKAHEVESAINDATEVIRLISGILRARQRMDD
jgi:four helix bundle protein